MQPASYSEKPQLLGGSVGHNCNLLRQLLRQNVALAEYSHPLYIWTNQQQMNQTAL